MSIGICKRNEQTYTHLMCIHVRKWVADVEVLTEPVDTADILREIDMLKYNLRYLDPSVMHSQPLETIG